MAGHPFHCFIVKRVGGHRPRQAGCPRFMGQITKSPGHGISVVCRPDADQTSWLPIRLPRRACPCSRTSRNHRAWTWNDPRKLACRPRFSQKGLVSVSNPCRFYAPAAIPRCEDGTLQSLPHAECKAATDGLRKHRFLHLCGRAALGRNSGGNPNPCVVRRVLPGNRRSDRLLYPACCSVEPHLGVVYRCWS